MHVRFLARSMCVCAWAQLYFQARCDFVMNSYLSLASLHPFPAFDPGIADAWERVKAARNGKCSRKTHVQEATYHGTPGQAYIALCYK